MRPPLYATGCADGTEPLLQHGFPVQSFLTFRQALGLGGHLREGERGMGQNLIRTVSEVTTIVIIFMEAQEVIAG